jgi:hypothetical protein
MRPHAGRHPNPATQLPKTNGRIALVASSVSEIYLAVNG